MKAVSSAALAEPALGRLELGSLPAGGSPRSASTFCDPRLGEAVEQRLEPSRVSPTQLRCAIASIPCSRLIRVAISTVPSRVAPPAP